MFAEVRIEETEEWEREVDLRALAACNEGTGSLTELFFSEDLYDIARAKHLCGSCPVPVVGGLRFEQFGVREDDPELIVEAVKQQAELR